MNRKNDAGRRTDLLRAANGPSRVNRTIRWFNKRVLNPFVLTFAGRRHSPYATLRHKGRRTGRVHLTPVVAHPTPEGFVIALPYGSDVEWCRNILAAGRCHLRREGAAYDLVDPVLVDSSIALPQLPRGYEAILRLFGLNARTITYLRLRRLGA
jgi:hypothetical protein